MLRIIKRGGEGVFQIPKSKLPRCPFSQNLGSQTSSGGPPESTGSIPLYANELARHIGTPLTLSYLKGQLSDGLKRTISRIPRLENQLGASHAGRFHGVYRTVKRVKASRKLEQKIISHRL
jgi:hypothetical protein